MKPYILGFQKCGLNSLIEYIGKRDNINSFTSTEDISSPRSLAKFLPYKDTHRPTIIYRRDKAAAIYSMYHYFGYSEKYTLEQFLTINIPHNQYGNENPIHRCNFEKHIAPFLDYNPEIFILEDMKDFPHKNKGGDRTGVPVPKMTPQQRKLIEDEIVNQC